MTAVEIAATGVWVPPHAISNEELVASFNTYVASYNQQHADEIARGEREALEPSSEAFIEKASGIRSRYVLDKEGILDPQRMCPRLLEREDDELSILAEIAVAAARQALERAQCAASDVDAVIVACSNLQRAYPAIAIEVQQELGMTRGFAYDMNVACSSATFGLQNAYSLISTGAADRVLVCNPEICSGHLDFRDRDAHFIFGDVATAVLVEAASARSTGSARLEVLGIKCATQFSNNIRNNFGFLDRTHRGDEGASTSERLFKQRGRRVFKEVSPMVADLIGEHLKELGLGSENIERLWLHQANRNMNELIARRVLGREATEREAPTILDEFANTSSAGSIIALDRHSDDLQQGDVGLLCSFGAGYSVGSVVLRKG